MSPTTRVSANILGILMETNGVPNVNSNDAWWHLYKVPALAFPVRTAGGVWGGSQSYGDFNLQAKSQGSGFMKTHQRQIWANMTWEPPTTTPPTPSRPAQRAISMAETTMTPLVPCRRP